MRKLPITLLLFAGVFLQALLPSPVFFGSTEWPILLSLIFWISLRSDSSGVVYAGILAGLLHDSFSPALLGISIPFFLLIALGVHAIRAEVFGDQIITYAVLGLLGGVAKALCFTLIFSVTGLRPVGVESIFFCFWESALLGVFTAPVIFLLLSGTVHRQIHKRRRMAW